MEERNNFGDELARRRTRQTATQALEQAHPTEEKLPRMGWRDVLALTIAAYQVLLPVFLGLVAALVLVYLLFYGILT